MGVASKMTKEERQRQEDIILKYKGLGIIPTMQKIKQETGVSITTIATFNSGNSANKAIRDYLRVRFKANKLDQEPDILELYDIWERDKEAED